MLAIHEKVIFEKLIKQEGNVLQEPAAAMNLMFPLKRLYNVAMKSVSRKEMVPKFHIMWSLSKITIRCPGYLCFNMIILLKLLSVA